MNAYIACLSDTLSRLLDEAKESEVAAAALNGQSEQAYELGRVEAFTNSLHTWKNQLETFGIGSELGETWKSLNLFLQQRGLP
ncbi:MAG: hypothetical protein ACK5EA_22500 [Planctomycetaceae bacterium]